MWFLKWFSDRIVVYNRDVVWIHDFCDKVCVLSRNDERLSALAEGRGGGKIRIAHAPVLGKICTDVPTILDAQRHEDVNFSDKRHSLPFSGLSRILDQLLSSLVETTLHNLSNH